MTERRPPPRRYTLSYLVTVWTQRAEDEHRVLSSLLACFLAIRPAARGHPDRGARRPALRPDPSTVALPPPQDRSLADVWSALGGELKPSLDLVVTVPFDTGRVLAAGPPVLVPPELGDEDRTATPATLETARRRSTARRRTRSERDHGTAPPTASLRHLYARLRARRGPRAGRRGAAPGRHPRPRRPVPRPLHLG